MADEKCFGFARGEICQDEIITMIIQLIMAHIYLYLFVPFIATHPFMLSIETPFSANL